MSCEHPPEQRWQARLHWLCCRCGQWFWGKKTDEPPYWQVYG
jgi:hypothetical protein